MKRIYTIFFVLLIGILSIHATRSSKAKNKPPLIISKIKNSTAACEGSPDYLAGYDAGRFTGHDLGVAEGTKNGSVVCYNAGYNFGFGDGSADGYDIGYADGHDDGTSVDNKTINSNKTNTDLAVVNSDCYDLGFANGHKEGYIAGYNEVLNSSFNTGYDYGYDDGFIAGYDKGYADGFADGEIKVNNPRYNPNDYPDKYPNSNSDCSHLTISVAGSILNSADFTSYYDLYSYSAANNIPGLSPGGSGANVTWDFSAMAAIFDGTFSTVPAASTPYAADFPTANLAYKMIVDGDPDFYAYYNVSSTAFELLGSKDSEYTDLLLDTSTIFKFPYTYQTAFTDNYRNEEDPVEGYTNTVTYDAYGTLKTPYDTYTNVIRRKSVEVDGEGTFTDYEWYSTNPLKLVMVMGFLDNTIQNQHSNYSSFFSSTKLGVKENMVTNLVSVYPNPTTSKLNLQFPNDKIINKVVIIDIGGKIVLQQNQNTTQVNVEKLSAGVYIIKAYFGNENFTSKFVKK